MMSSTTNTSQQDENFSERTPEFYSLLQEFYDLKAMSLVPHAKNSNEAWAFIRMNNLMDSLMTTTAPATLQ